MSMYRIRVARRIVLACTASHLSPTPLKNESHLYAKFSSMLASPSQPNVGNLQPTSTGRTAALSTAVCVLTSSSVAAEAEARTQNVNTKREDLRQDMPEITLYQYEVCPFCNKVRAFLDFHNVPYRVVEVDPIRKGEIKFSKDYKMVPIALVGDKQVNGSQEIIAAIEKVMRGEVSGIKRDAEEEKWIEWTDNHLIHLISPNIYRTAKESMQAFDYIADNSKFGAVQRFTIRYTGALAMYFVARKIQKKYDIKDARKELYEALDSWMAAVNEHGGAYLGGKDGPSVADLSIYGVLKACENFDTFRDVRKNKREFTKWFDNMKSVVGTTGIIERM